MDRKRRRTVVLAIGTLLALAGVCIGGLYLSRSRSYQVFGEIIPRVETSERVIALTFDDGPTPKALETLLPVLRERNVKATFFVVGEVVEKFPQLGVQIAREGHELGNHSYSHRRMVFKSLSFIDEEIRRTDRAIRSLGYEGPIPFRPPYGKKLFLLPYYLSEQQRPTITWDIEPDAYPDVARNADKIAGHVLAKARPGSIVLLHPMYRNNKPALDAVGKIIDGLQQRGYKFVTVSELMSLSSSTVTTVTTPMAAAEVSANPRG